MRERGLMFSGAMVRGVLADVDPKTQTRRVCKLPRGVDFIGAGGRKGPDWDDPSCWGFEADDGTWWVLQRGPEAQPWQQPTERELPSPYGEVGDRLWVRETWGLCRHGDPTDWYRGKVGPTHDLDRLRQANRVEYRADWGVEQEQCFWRPSILMPRWASRITLEITGRRVERLHDITDEDIRAEGVTAEAVRALLGRDTVDLGIVSANGRRDPRSVVATPIADLSLRELWEVGWTAINGAESWASNPFVRVIRFRRVEAT